jgi:hypothetical protein
MECVSSHADGDDSILFFWGKFRDSFDYLDRSVCLLTIEKLIDRGCDALNLYLGGGR